jgi:hypothetical protein
MLTGREVGMKTGWVAVVDIEIDTWEELADTPSVTIAKTLRPES